jgi:hypothetical protein
MSTVKAINLQHPTAANANIVLNSSGNIGIGTSTPTAGRALTLNSANNYYGIDFQYNGTSQVKMIQEATGSLYVDYNEINGSGALNFRKYGGSNVLKLDSSGYVTTPFQPVFAAYGGTTQSWSGTGAYQVLQLNSQAVTTNSRGSGYSTGAYRFTAPVAGMYMFFGKITQSTNVGGPSLYLFVNGSAVMAEMTIDYGVSYMSSSGMWPYYMNAGDYADLRVINLNNVSMTLDLSRCNFVGWLLG